jgi:hypothetical protein
MPGENTEEILAFLNQFIFSLEALYFKKSGTDRL